MYQLLCVLMRNLSLFMLVFWWSIHKQQFWVSFDLAIPTEQTDILLGWTCSQSTSVILNLNAFLPLSTCYLIISLFTLKRNDESWTLGYREPNTLNKINLIMSAVSSMVKISEGYSNTRKEELCSIENNDEQILREKSAKSGLQVNLHLRGFAVWH